MSTVGSLQASQAPSWRVLRRLLAVIVGVLVLIVGVVLIGPEPTGLPLDPDSAADDGLLGLVRLLEDLDVEVTVSDRLPTDPSTRVFLPVDQVSGDRRDELGAFVRAGGTVIVAGPTRLHDLDREDAPFVDALGRTPRSAGCAELDGTGSVLQDAWAAHVVPADAIGCFPVTDRTAWLVALVEADGQIIALGSAAPFTNALLAEEGNAVIAARLLAPDAGERLVIVPRGEIGEGETPLLELVPDGFLRGLALVVVALLAAVLWRARRLGRPVAERLPPVLPSAELARSIADLLQRAGDRGAAAARLRAAARDDARRALGLSAGTPAGPLVDLVIARTAVAADDARLVLLDAPVPDDRELTRVAAATGRVRAGLRRPASP